MKRRSRFERPQPGPFLPTGHHCPQSGWWTPGVTGGEARYISEGSVMPTAGGRPVLWAPAARGNCPSSSHIFGV
jgi:hypothetical protein